MVNSEKKKEYNKKYYDKIKQLREKVQELDIEKKTQTPITKEPTTTTQETGIMDTLGTTLTTSVTTALSGVIQTLIIAGVMMLPKLITSTPKPQIPYTTQPETTSEQSQQYSSTFPAL